MIQEPIQIAPELLRCLSPQVASSLLTGRRLQLPGPMIWHEWGHDSLDQGASTLVLLHGGSGSWTHWIRNVAPLVANGFHVLAVDLPGFGDSALPENGGDVDALIEPLHAALQMLRVSEKLSFIGFSFGGMAATLWLAAYPQDAQKLILVGSPGLGIKSPHRVPLKGWRHLPTEELQVDAHRHNLLALMLHDESKLDELAMTLHRLNVARDRMPRRRLSGTPIVADALPLIACPVHVIYGEWDALYHGCMPEVEKLVKNITPQLASWQLVSGSGHWVQFESPEAFQLALKKTL
ncbi:MAG: alpha/beta hydrolase [Betaproteobacteria bacterium]